MNNDRANPNAASAAGNPVIVGSGLLAKAFARRLSGRAGLCIYAAGVSNSGCSDAREFERERARLSASLLESRDATAFIYFGTCSVGDPELLGVPYVQHKLAMEQLVARHPNHLILRLPQVAGVTPNPHTLLNFLHARISRSETFSLWRNAHRNILDVEDVAEITEQLCADPGMRRLTMNVANPISYSMPEIVRAMEQVVGKRALYDEFQRGNHYRIAVEPMLRALGAKDIGFGDDYLNRIIRKYYEPA